MSTLDALRLSDVVRSRLVRFAVYDRFVRDRHLASACANLWGGPPDQGGLVSDLWVEGAFPSELSTETLDSLAAAGQFSQELCAHLDMQRDAVPRHRRLYTHQAAAIQIAQAASLNGLRPTVVVTASTGGGKTESFLLPLLNDLYSRRDAGAPGVKCILLYPTNALVNDQVDRLYGWLTGQSGVSLFHFTSETPEDAAAAARLGIGPWEACRIRTRQEARGLETRAGKAVSAEERRSVPDIIITNYSMLEYMLCRPQDACFFGPALRSIVLDEAHLYTGTLAAEITLLLRRVLARCGVSPDNVLQMATSATIGSGNPAELQEFAATIFSKSPSLVSVIQGRNTRVPLHNPPAPPHGQPSAADVAPEWLKKPLLVADAMGNLTIADDSDTAAALRQRLPLLVDETMIPQQETRPAVLLREALAAAPLIHQLEAQLWEHSRLPLTALSERLWASADRDAVRATVSLLQLGASARNQAHEYPLVPHRIHMLVRPTDGIFVCLDQHCSGPADRKLPSLGAVGTGISDVCPECGGAALAIHRCDNCGEWLFSTRLDHERIRSAAWPTAESRYYRLDALGQRDVLWVNPRTGSFAGAGGEGLRLTRVDECPNCKASLDELRPFAAGTPLTLAVLAETALSEMPEYPSPKNRWLPASGRRILAFSDSRQEAARLGPRLTRQHATQVLRAAIVTCLNESPPADTDLLDAIQDQIREYEQKLADPNIPPNRHRYIEQQLLACRQQHVAFADGGSIAEWSRKLQHVPLLEQLMDVESAEDHRADAWGQESWERNRDQVIEHAGRLLAAELARRVSPVEKFGMIEVTYPGVDDLVPPAEVLGLLPHDTARDTLKRCWSDLVRGLLDTLRSEGVITLGQDAQDDLYVDGHVVTGRWTAAEREHGGKLIRFTGKQERHRRRRFATWVLQAAGMPSSEATALAETVLLAVFAQLLDRATPEGAPAAANQFNWLEQKIHETFDGAPAAAIRLKCPALGLRRPLMLYRCRKTGHVWPRSVLGCAPETGCERTLDPVTEMDLDQDVRIGEQRRELAVSKVFQMGLWAEEHSAQLAPQENRRLQDLFKLGQRNILSATTTLELGIDIGGLNAVLMSNVPPGKANYLQRAGRAGRRADGSSIVITFARSRPFDQAVFGHFGEYLSQELRKPAVFLDRERVVRRHLHSFLLGHFFQSVYARDAHVGTMTAFGNMGVFSGVALPQKWDKDSQQAPQLRQPIMVEPADAADINWWNPALRNPGLEAQYLSFLYWLRDFGEHQFRSYVEDLFQDTIMAAWLGRLEPDGSSGDWDDTAWEREPWYLLFTRVIDDFNAAIRGWRNEYETLFITWHVAANRAQANAIRYQLAALHELTVIEALADRQFLPHYGFPIGVQKLRVIEPDPKREGKVREAHYRLERSSLLALREYVPGSQLLAGGKLVSSRGLLKHWTGANLDNYLGLRGQFANCKNGHFHYWTSGPAKPCPKCEAGPKHAGDLLFPKHGFSGAAWDPPKWSTDVERIGSAQTASMTFMQPIERDATQVPAVFDFGEVHGLTADYREKGELLVYNQGEKGAGFAICLKCGYADSETKYGDQHIHLPTGFGLHAPLTSPRRFDRCWKSGDGAVLRNQVLAARETTDVLLLDFSGCLGPWASDQALVTTLGYALQRAGAQRLEMDSRELGVMMVPVGERGRNWGIILYDAVPGGAGHVRELMGAGRTWLEDAVQVMYVDAQHDARCDTACLQCLLSFDDQAVMAQNLLQRRMAVQLLRQLLDGRELPMYSHAVNPFAHLEVAATSPAVPVMSVVERRKAAANKRQPKR